MNLKRTIALIAVALCAAASAWAGEAKPAAAGKKSAAELEKEKAMANPYPNDYGPEKLTDADLAGYPADIKKGYSTMLTRCAQCHSAARPLNSRFVEPGVGADAKPAERDAKENAAIASLKKTEPDVFKDKSVWQVEASIWNRYVKRMMAKPGCKISPAEGKEIYRFLVYDGEKRKLGANAAKWKAHRLSLINKLKAEKPHRYEELKKDNDL